MKARARRARRSRSRPAAKTAREAAEKKAAKKAAAPAEICEQNQGSIKLAPGLSETPHVQSITVKGELGSCDGPLNIEGGTYLAHLKTIGEVTCSTLSSLSAEPTTESVWMLAKWLPAEVGISHGSLSMPITEAPGEGLQASLQGGPFAAGATLSAASLSESFSGASGCGVPVGKRRAQGGQERGLLDLGRRDRSELA